MIQELYDTIHSLLTQEPSHTMSPTCLSSKHKQSYLCTQ